MIAVNTVPTRTPRTGFENMTRMLLKVSLPLRMETASDIMSIPNMRIANPRRIIPTSFLLGFFWKAKRITPMNATTGTNASGFKRLRRKKLPPSIA